MCKLSVSASHLHSVGDDPRYADEPQVQGIIPWPSAFHLCFADEDLRCTGRTQVKEGEGLYGSKWWSSWELRGGENGVMVLKIRILGCAEEDGKSLVKPSRVRHSSLPLNVLLPDILPMTYATSMCHRSMTVLHR
ncbi:hypothetical protein HAX54_052627 [Datura stramonium]|uniref:Uncharacterized protein n=1 Tax=Datura stramonium TaxID=4076 RepID=A0ABS8WSL7_DATST|nr:hypothetical protein [Datura stramonium]